MSNSVSRKQKWSGTSVRDRQSRASRLRSYRKHVSAARARAGEIAVVREIVRPDVLQQEARITRSAWVAYGYMTAIRRTELFCELYLDAYRTHYGQVRDYLTAARQIPVSPDLFQNDSRQINSLWRARQEADRLGMPYEVFLDATMAWAARQKNRKQLLAPNQLYSAKALAAAQARWSDSRDTFAIFADEWDARLFVGDEKCSRPRLQALRLLKHRVMMAKNPEITLANYMGRLGAIDEALARRVFHRRPGLVEDALRSLVDPLPPPKRDPPTTHIPACLGLQAHARDPACSDCTLATQCARLWDAATAELKHATGSADPQADKKRQLATERKRRQRDRERAAALVSDTP
ncbi:hypothetical protein MUU77_02730 [Pseudoxanthomonas sp. F37]|uniref:hypothetical protein n=1 Tax=Pseudoxanthomonas sp. F37 TaxID=2932492 RepID=UPI001FD22CD6|nr:hypothetical protein [Pseudoxanthomonas sp. F37]UOV09239.1 hypothetical protein MUU77_02730 [Pseudoxanthomonas sp. F37]